ncbi:TIGR03885 family FMN-dependent LLM class oxidoreductase [Quadrisphaera sp. GCM10027208]|uniref:TIGR03885 family FMN-dependent LLM class oxidoreductase n=1 Tax=Quadrisphaera sp. GCM10027208 TaxID=3273423 RepID=UPI003607D9BB
MTVIGFHASHEQIPPSRLLGDVRHAEQAGFQAAMCSDHIEPWSQRQGHSGFAWSWLGAAMATTNLPFGVVSAPGQRYHPAVIAQASATLAEMFPDRFWVALGSGEHMNEHVTGQHWPRKEQRNQRLLECVDVIRRLHAGEEVSHDGLVTVDRARVWSRPASPPPLVVPAVSVETARWGASWADGLATINQPADHLADMLAAYRDAGGRGKTVLQVHLSWAPTEQEAYAIAYDQWRTNVWAPPVPWDLETAGHFDALGDGVSEQQVRGSVLVSSDLGRLTGWIADLVGLGFDEVYLHHVGQDQEPYLDAFGQHVLPQLSGL